MPKTCPRCQTENADTEQSCSNCGASLTRGRTDTRVDSATTTSSPSVGAQPGANATPVAGGRSSVPAYKFDATRWTVADRIAGVASLVLFISLFLSWFSASIGPISVSTSGLSAHSSLYVVMILCIAILVYLAVCAGWDEVRRSKKVPHLTVMLIATAVNLVLTVIAFVEKPGGVGFNTGIGWDFGAVLALIASIVAAAPFLVPRLRAKTM